MRILFFNTAHRWIGEAAGTDLLARLLVDRGHDVVMFVPRGGEVAKQIVSRPGGYRVVALPWRISGGKGDTLLRQYRYVRSAIARLRPDIIHVGRGQEHWCAALVRPFASSKSRIVRMRHVVMSMKQSAANRWLFKYGTDAVTAVSNAAFRGIGALGGHLPNDRRRVVLGAVDSSRYSSDARSEDLRRSLGITGDNDFLIGLIGRWQGVKGQEIFMRAMSDVMDRHANVRAVMAGRKVSLDRWRVKKYHQMYRMEGRMNYRGMMTDPERLIASLDIGVIASRGSEGFSRIAVEYFASRVPVVATSVGALPEIVRDGETGLIVPPNDAIALVRAIEKLILDASLRRQFAESAYEDARERFSPARYAEEMESIYSIIL